MCGVVDIACHMASYLDPWFTWWAGVVAFIKAWWWVPFGAVCMAVGAHLGPVRTYAVLTAGVVALVLRFWPQKGQEPDYETGEPQPAPKPKKKPKTLLDIFRDLPD